MVALFAAELTRTIVKRRIDIGVWGTLGIGACGILTVFPTLGAAREFLPHLWDREGATSGPYPGGPTSCRCRTSRSTMNRRDG